MPVDVSGLVVGVNAIAAGGTHTCALTSPGGVKCWGYNYYGQLGDGTNLDRLAPVDVTGLGSGVKAITAGDSHTCAIASSGGVKCWGKNLDGQLGDGTNGNRAFPVDVPGLGSGVKAIDANYSHTCALTSSGGVKCWGYNYFGQLGNGTTSNSSLPVDVSGLGSGVNSIAAGGSHSCALMLSGSVKCWGYNYDGELGNDDHYEKHTPVNVFGFESGINAISTGSYHSCALSSSGGVYCWGNNYSSQIGDGSGLKITPVSVLGTPQ